MTKCQRKQLVIEKGNKKMYIPYGRQTIEEDDIKAVLETLSSDFLTTGPKIEEFEQSVAHYVGAKYAVAVSNGTAALHVACLAAGIGEGDEVITTPNTFVASANCALYCKATPVFADIKKDSYNIDPEDIKRKITSKTKAIIAVHFAGQPCEMDEIHRLAKEHHLLVIEDAAHALGAEYHGKRVGGLSDMTTFSFHPVKHITTGEGGMITTNNKELYEKLKRFRSHGITRDELEMTKMDGAWYYEQFDLGFNYRITDIQCALGICQMKKLDRFVKRRIAIRDAYDRAFRDIKGITIPTEQQGVKSSWHLYVILVEHRKAVFDELRKRNIGVNVHYIPVYKQPYYHNHGYEQVACENAEYYYDHCISLPIFPGLTDEEQDYVIWNVLEVVEAMGLN